jgi:hypothetical protein
MFAGSHQHSPMVCEGVELELGLGSVLEDCQVVAGWMVNPLLPIDLKR